MSKFKATIYVKSVFEIDYDFLKKKGIKLLCFDLDNTLDRPDQDHLEFTPGIEELITNLKKEFEIIIVSNNAIAKRVQIFADYFELPYIAQMHKPFQKKYQENEILNNYPKEQIIFIGDKMATDIIGANMFKAKSILVDPMYVEFNPWYSKIMIVADHVVSLFTGFKKGRYYNDWRD